MAAKNPVQFQPTLSLIAFLDWVGESHGCGVGRDVFHKTVVVAALQCTSQRHPFAMRMDEVFKKS